MNDEKEPILTNSAVPFPSTAIAREAAEKDEVTPDLRPEVRAPDPAEAARTSAPNEVDVTTTPTPDEQAAVVEAQPVLAPVQLLAARTGIADVEEDVADGSLACHYVRSRE